MPASIFPYFSRQFVGQVFGYVVVSISQTNEQMQIIKSILSQQRIRVAIPTKFVSIYDNKACVVTTMHRTKPFIPFL